MKKWQFSPKQYSSISLKNTKKEVATPLFMNNDGSYFLFRSICLNIGTLTAKIWQEYADHWNKTFLNINITQTVI